MMFQVLDHGVKAHCAQKSASGPASSRICPIPGGGWARLGVRITSKSAQATAASRAKIGRASCRERVETAAAAAALQAREGGGRGQGGKRGGEEKGVEVGRGRRVR